MSLFSRFADSRHVSDQMPVMARLLDANFSLTPNPSMIFGECQVFFKGIQIRAF